MVSTRQSSNVGGNENSGNADQSPSRILRHAVGHLSSIDSHLSPPATNEATLNKPLNLLDLPVEILETIFGFLPHKNVSDLRLVCRKVDTVCGNILNTTFQRLQTQMLNRFQSIKAKMPRRESARRTHPLACESDIIETLHMRLTLLQMTFGKHIERRHCCFFAGEILDEVYRVLNYIKITPSPLARPYKVTDELFDLSTMAMEYFKERIEPTLPEIAYFGTDFLDFGTFSSPGPSNNKSYMCLDSPPHKSFDNNSVEDTVDSPPQSNMVLRKRIRKIKQGMKRYNSQLSLMRRDLRNCKSRIAEQQKQILEYASRLDENDKKNEETSRKFSTLLQELNKCKTELQYWRSKSPANPPVCTACGKVLTPVPSEDLQALANQGVMPEGFGFGFDSEGALAGGSSDLLSIASSSNDDDLEQENDAISPMEDPSIVLDLDSSVCRESDNKDTSFPSTSMNKEVLQPLSPQTCRSIKRKASDEFYSCHESKKTRRSKRSKV